MGKLKTNLYSISEIVDADINTFEIKSYQRGYRWDIDNVKTLIQDITQCEEGKIYCMQPLVVTLLSNGAYEVIDGQQRLTTFKILAHCLQSYLFNIGIGDFQIIYETRSCASFINKLYGGDYSVDISELTLESVRDLWSKSVSDPKEFNRDNFHLFQSYCSVMYLLRRKSKDELHSFAEKLKTQVKFIWYEVDLQLLNTTAEKLFSNINKNKIRLTGADLIKALFILDIDHNDSYNLEVKHHKKQILAHEWDEIEQNLRNPNFWFFITNTNEQHYDVRIGKLFDIITHNKQETDLGSYFIMKKEFELRNWDKIYQNFRIAFEWYEDIYLYHRIGFLVNMNILSFEEILNEYQDQKTTSKSVFVHWLNGYIKKYIQSFELSEINYEKHAGRFGHCTGVLMLYNILLLEKYYPSQKFMFGDFVEHDWSLEHIQPQKPRDKNASSWIEWLKVIEIIIQEKFINTEQKILKVDKDQYGIEELNFNDLFSKLSVLSNQSKISSDLLVQLNILQDLFEEEFPTHKIQNLALLDKNTNSKLSNGTFKEKRSVILQLNDSIGQEKTNKELVFLPLGTINVFSKTMNTDSQNLQLDYWSIKDSELYFLEIKNIISPYLYE